ncbi:MAG: ABC transporter permease [Chitinophagales bacterium]|nr:ABC transporter permease [Chitinophagales bacterium]
MIAKLTWRNLWRNPRRTLITMTSVTFAVLLAILMQSFQKGVFDNLVKNVVSFYHGYIQVHKKGYWDEQVLDNSFQYDDSLVMKLSRNPEIKVLTPRIETFLLASVGNSTKGCMLVGTDPVKENLLTGLKDKIVKGRYFTDNEAAVLIAEGLAGRLKLTVQDTIILLGQGYHGAMAAGKYPVRGIIHFGSPALNDGLLYMPLAQAQFFLSAENMLTSLAVGIREPEKMTAIQQLLLSEMGKEYEVMNWKELMPDIANHIKADGSSFYIFTGVLYLIIAFGIFGTILMMTAERRYEFGMLVAIGMKKLSLGKILLFETLLITLLGVITGLLISLPFVLYFSRNPLRITGEIAEAYERFGFEALFPAAVDNSILIVQSLIVLIIAFLIGLYPLWHVGRINPMLAMKK